MLHIARAHIQHVAPRRRPLHDAADERLDEPAHRLAHVPEPRAERLADRREAALDRGACAVADAAGFGVCEERLVSNDPSTYPGLSAWE